MDCANEARRWLSAENLRMGFLGERRMGAVGRGLGSGDCTGCTSACDDKKKPAEAGCLIVDELLGLQQGCERISISMGCFEWKIFAQRIPGFFPQATDQNFHSSHVIGGWLVTKRQGHVIFRDRFAG